MDELIQEYYELKKQKEKYEEQLSCARGDAKIPNVHYLDDLDDRRTILGIEFQLDRINKRMKDIEETAKEFGITSEEPHKTK